MRTDYQSKSEAKISIDTLASLLYNSLDEMRASDFIKQMKQRVDHDYVQMGELSRQMDRLSAAHNKYLDAQARAAQHKRSMEKLTGLLGSVRLVPKIESESDLNERDKIQNLRDELELWEAVQQYLRFVPYARIREILEFLELVNIKTTRQAVEACINTRPKIFSVRKEKREKFVSLKTESL